MKKYLVTDNELMVCIVYRKTGEVVFQQHILFIKDKDLRTCETSLKILETLDDDAHNHLCEVAIQEKNAWCLLNPIKELRRYYDSQLEFERHLPNNAEVWENISRYLVSTTVDKFAKTVHVTFIDRSARNRLGSCPRHPLSVTCDSQSELENILHRIDLLDGLIYYGIDVDYYIQEAINKEDLYEVVYLEDVLAEYCNEDDEVCFYYDV